MAHYYKGDPERGCGLLLILLVVAIIVVFVLVALVIRSHLP